MTRTLVGTPDPEPVPSFAGVAATITRAATTWGASAGRTFSLTFNATIDQHRRTYQPRHARDDDH